MRPMCVAGFGAGVHACENTISSHPVLTEVVGDL